MIPFSVPLTSTLHCSTEKQETITVFGGNFQNLDQKDKKKTKRMTVHSHQAACCHRAFENDLRLGTLAAGTGVFLYRKL